MFILIVGVLVSWDVVYTVSCLNECHCVCVAGMCPWLCVERCRQLTVCQRVSIGQLPTATCVVADSDLRHVLSSRFTAAFCYDSVFLRVYTDDRVWLQVCTLSYASSHTLLMCNWCFRRRRIKYVVVAIDTTVVCKVAIICCTTSGADCSLGAR